VLENNADKEALRARVEEVWRQLAAESNKRIGCGFLE